VFYSYPMSSFGTGPKKLASQSKSIGSNPLKQFWELKGTDQQV